MSKIKKKIENDYNITLTNRQMTFAKFYVDGIYSNAECARKAGYSEKVASLTASKLLNGRDYPYVLDYVKELREERQRRYGVTTIGQLERLSVLECRGRGSRTIFSGYKCRENQVSSRRVNDR